MHTSSLRIAKFIHTTEKGIAMLKKRIVKGMLSLATAIMLVGSDPVKDRSSRRIIRFPGRWCYGIPDLTAYERHFKYAGRWLVIHDRFIYYLYRTR